MCTPLAIAALALTAGGVAANQMASNQVERKREGYLSAERERQKGYHQKAENLNAESASKFGDFAEDQTTKAQQLGDLLAAQSKSLPTGQTGQTSVASPLPSSSSNIVSQERAKQLGKTNEYSTQQAHALGNLRSFADILANDNMLMAKNDSLIGQEDSFMKGSSSVLPLELEAANNAGSGWRLAGTIMSGLGTAASLGSAAVAGGAAGAAEGAAQAGAQTAEAGSGAAAAASSGAGAGSGSWFSDLSKWFVKPF